MKMGVLVRIWEVPGLSPEILERWTFAKVRERGGGSPFILKFGPQI